MNKISMTPQQVAALLALVPTSIHLVNRLLDVIETLQAEDIQVPDTAELLALRERLNKLPDL